MTELKTLTLKIMVNSDEEGVVTLLRRAKDKGARPVIASPSTQIDILSITHEDGTPLGAVLEFEQEWEERYDTDYDMQRNEYEKAKAREWFFAGLQYGG